MPQVWCQTAAGRSAADHRPRRHASIRMLEVRFDPGGSDLGKSEAQVWMEHRAAAVMITIVECQAIAAHQLGLAMTNPHRRLGLIGSADRWTALAERIRDDGAATALLRDAVLSET